MVLASGCVAGGDEPTATIEIKTDTTTAVTIDHPVAELRDAVSEASVPDVCSLAAELPTSDVCSLICDPPAMAQYLIDEGMHGGTCYQLRCVLPGRENAVMVGVCLL
ncbi:MAG TPA: hypothetical protein VMZ53_11060 [Kofleriaceae bacterium]|nr:hypothetical protein [Kofleriaceae bacterium]